ncbi:MAG: hypothetical protein SAJ12_18385 [Jaaginema sp. PMC 1079.18]|nr:hypothetical protein [Jaaginema sp. PMC 1080.18]MEC4852954.1 hypothetical protein [Jaaginema sp. PMC 1079.18]MEC4864833.1 hypothetical protein [Jaaginema sp. PMC 1078.18]
MVLLSLAILSISAVGISLNPAVVPGVAWLIGGSLVILSIFLQRVRHSPPAPNTLQNSLHWLWGTWAIASLIFVPLLLWSSFLQTRQTLSLLIGQGVAIAIVGAIIVGTVALLKVLAQRDRAKGISAPGIGLVLIFVPIAAAGLLLLFNLGLGWLYLGQTVTNWLIPEVLESLLLCWNTILLPPLVQIGIAIALHRVTS